MECYNGFHTFLNQEEASKHGIDFAKYHELFMKKSSYEESLAKKFKDVEHNVLPDSHSEKFVRLVHDKKEYFFSEFGFTVLCDELTEKIIHTTRADRRGKKFEDYLIFKLIRGKDMDV